MRPLLKSIPCFQRQVMPTFGSYWKSKCAKFITPEFIYLLFLSQYTCVLKSHIDIKIRTTEYHANIFGANIIFICVFFLLLCVNLYVCKKNNTFWKKNWIVENKSHTWIQSHLNSISELPKKMDKENCEPYRIRISEQRIYPWRPLAGSSDRFNLIGGKFKWDICFARFDDHWTRWQCVQ